MIRKTSIAYLIFVILLCYIVSSRFFEKNFFLNEFLSLMGVFVLIYKKFRTGNDFISRLVLFLLSWSFIHVIVSVFRMDSLYYYFRNLVIVYSIFSFYLGYCLYPYLHIFISRVYRTLKYYVSILLVVPISTFLFERFVMSTLFPVVLKKLQVIWILPALIIMNIIYAVSYDSATAIALAGFYSFLFIMPNYRFFQQLIFAGIILFIVFFILIQPNLNLISVNNFSPYNSNAIYQVINSNPLLSLDGNTTWRLVLWKQVLVDNFPQNIFGLGFGTPLMKYYPVEDYSKLSSLPYVMGAHNSYIYLFGRLGILYFIFLVLMFTKIFKEYFYYKEYYYSNKIILLFFSFFAITIVALFNPTLESPIYASLYWILLGFLARAIYNRNRNTKNEDFAYS